VCTHQSVLPGHAANSGSAERNEDLGALCWPDCPPFLIPRRYFAAARSGHRARSGVSEPLKARTDARLPVTGKGGPGVAGDHPPHLATRPFSVVTKPSDSVAGGSLGAKQANHGRRRIVIVVAVVHLLHTFQQALPCARMSCVAPSDICFRDTAERIYRCVRQRHPGCAIARSDNLYASAP
jgi:hypothetical protein